jgi:prefoldin subunit 4
LILFIRYQLNDIFIELKVEAARERSEKQLETSKAKLEELSDKTDSIRSKMDALKKVLYGKFGQSINLEVD